MKFQLTSALTVLLLNTSALSFGANSPKNIQWGSSRSSSSFGITFVSGGATTSTVGSKSRASVGGDATCLSAAVTPENLELLSERGRNAILSLIEHDVDGAQEHVYGDWPEAGVEDDGKKLLVEQVCRKISIKLSVLHAMRVFVLECNTTIYKSLTSSSSLGFYFDSWQTWIAPILVD